nr:MAG TPA: hypothetical protein [Caudoviricetes sp.]
MKTLQLSEQKARELYRSGSKELKTVLEESFGKDFFSQDVTERVKTYLDACHELGREPLDEKKLLELGLTEHDIAYQKLAIVTEALNEGWKADWDNSDENKYYPYFIMSPSSFAFCGSGYVNACAFAGSGSRLCYKTRELAEYSAKQFIDIWKDIQIG